MGTKLHPPYPNQTACMWFRTENCLQCLKTVGLYNSFGGGRFSFWQSWLTWPSRFANSQASTLNAGVSTDLYSPESNCLYLALICTPCEPAAQSSSRLVWAWWIEYFQCNLYVNTVNMSQKETHLISMRFKSQLTMKLEKKPPKWVNVSSRVAVSRVN